MNPKIIKSLYKKEILDVLRDKKTVVMMLVVPLVLYPLVVILSLQLMSGITKNITKSTYRICLDFEDDGSLSKRFLNVQDAEYSFEIVECEDPVAGIQKEKVDAVIKKNMSGNKQVFTVTYMSSVNKSSYAVNMIESVLNKYSSDITKDILTANGLSADDVLQPIKIDFVDISTGEETAGNLLGTLIPFMLIMSLLMGTMYPAIDTTAGEKERGTLETLITLPVSNQELIMSKFLAVATIGIVSAVLNLISMGGVGAYMYGMLSSVMNTNGKVNLTRFVPAICIGILCVFAFAIFISAISMCVCAMANSYKEANNYLTPLTLVVMFASFISFIPNVVLDIKTAVIPVANVCLLIKDLLAFKYNISMIGLVLFVNAAYGFIAVLILSRIYNSEAIIFGENGAFLQIFEKRSNLKKGGVPALSDCMLVIIVLAMLVIYAGSVMQLKLGMAGLFFTQLIIAGIPLFAVIYTKKDMRTTFKLKACGGRYFLGGACIALGGVFLGIILSEISGVIFKDSAKTAADAMAGFDVATPVIGIIVMAVAPAICEELMFRGYVLSTMSARYKKSTAIIVSACIFGVYHMSASKFLATAFLGGLICYVATSAGSILPGMLMHFINNLIASISLYYPDKLARLFPLLAKESLGMRDVALLFAVGTLLVAAGIIIVARQKKTIDGKKA